MAINAIICADDAHGTAIMLGAEKEGIKPEDYINRVRDQHMADFALFHIGYDEYYYHSSENEALSQQIYLAEADGGIETRDIEQYFCEQTQLLRQIGILKVRAQMWR